MTDFEKFNKLFRVDFETGKLYWKIVKSPIFPGKEAGHFDKKGYGRVMVDGKMYLIHRVIFLLAYGRWPASILDHFDRDPSHNRLENLRESNNSENGLNSKIRCDNTTGAKGLYFDERVNRWSVRKRGKSLGYYQHKEDAILAYEQAP